jgi:hypothetical protein
MSDVLHDGEITVCRSFGQDDIGTMTTALDAAWNVLLCSDSPFAKEPVRSGTKLLLAQRILDSAQAGEKKYGQLLMSALEGLIDTSGDSERTSGC